ncbi:MAG: division/cell wall cluster transcriptional repressor MraZ [Christensenellales bacterium]
MFFCSGEQRLSMDDKGRMRIPKKMREKLGGSDDEIVIYAANNYCLYVVPMDEFNSKYVEVSRNTMFKETEKQEALRRLCSTVFVPDEDDQGRFILPPKLKELAKIQKKIVFLGVLDRIEIWSEEIYNERFAIEGIDLEETVRTLDI